MAQEEFLPAYPESVSVAVSQKIPVQGKLTNSVGSPLTGDFNLTFRVYNTETFGTPLCDDSHQVSVENGLFNTTIEGCTPAEINGQQLYVSIEVENDGEMRPRQALYPVPYAFSLVEGAKLGTFQSTAKSYLFISVMDFVCVDCLHLGWDVSIGPLVKFFLSTDTPRKPRIKIPVAIPAVLYGQPVKVSQIRVYYKCQDENHFINKTQLYLSDNYNGYWKLVSDTDQDMEHKSTTADYYDVDTKGPSNQLFADQGSLVLELGMDLKELNKTIYISGVRLTLEHDYD